MSTVSAELDWAAAQAESLLAPLGDRWLHVQGVARVSECVGAMFDEKNWSTLVAAAYLHDIGYARQVRQTGFHPLDGARYLQGLGLNRLASLVAYHSGAYYEAQLLGWLDELKRFAQEHSAVADALTYCDLITGPTGAPISLKQRSADIMARYGKGHPVYQAHRLAFPRLCLAYGRTVRRLRQAGLQTCTI